MLRLPILWFRRLFALSWGDTGLASGGVHCGPRGGACEDTAAERGLVRAGEEGVGTVAHDVAHDLYSVTHAIDISAYQHRRGIDWNTLAGSRYRLVVSKLSEARGHSQLDIALECGRAARDRGMDFAVYHFVDKRLRFSARHEAEHFMRLLEHVDHLCTIAPTLDFEPSGTGNAWGERSLTRAQCGEWCAEWADRVGFTPILYTPAKRSYVGPVAEAMPDSPLWLSSRPYGASPPDDPPIGDMPNTARLWQYTSKSADVPGIIGTCDRNLVIDLDGLRQSWHDRS